MRLTEGIKAQPGLSLRRGITTGLTGLAFWNSYGHTVQWFEDQDQKGAHGLALIPEAGVILVVLSLAGGRLSRPEKAVVSLFGGLSVGITLASNLAGAGPGRAGVAAALVAPVFAVLGFTLEVLGLRRPEPEAEPEPLSLIPEPLGIPVEPSPAAESEPLIPPVSLEPEPPAKPEPVIPVEPPAGAQFDPPAEPEPRKDQGSGLTADGIKWALSLRDQGSDWPTVQQIEAQYPGISRATRNRIRAAGTKIKSDVTADQREGVNA